MKKGHLQFSAGLYSFLFIILHVHPGPMFQRAGKTVICSHTWIFDRHKKPSTALSKAGHSFLGTKGSMYCVCVYVYLTVCVREREGRDLVLIIVRFCGTK